MRPPGHGLILGRSLPERSREVGFVGKPQHPSPGGELITYAGDAPIITVAATGGGKTSGPVAVNARTYPGQLICLDVKGEAYRLSADYRRRMGQKVCVLDLRDDARATGALNPLDMAVMQGEERIAIARAFAAELIERPPPGGAKDFFWIDWAETMLTAAIAYLMIHQPHKCRLSELFDFYGEGDVPYKVAVCLDNVKEMNRATQTAWTAFCELPTETTRPCVLASTTTALRLFESDLVRRLTDTTTIDLKGLVAGKPMSLFIIVPPHRIRAYAPLLRLWLSGLMNLLSTRETVPRLPTLMMVDEAAQLGRVDSFITAMTLMRGYGLRLWSFWQAASQLEIYGPHAKSIIDNAGVVQIFGLRNHRAAAETAALVGGIMPETLLSMGAEEQMVMVEGSPPSLCRQVRYYSDQMFAGLR